MRYFHSKGKYKIYHHNIVVYQGGASETVYRVGKNIEVQDDTREGWILVILFDPDEIMKVSTEEGQWLTIEKYTSPTQLSEVVSTPSASS